MAGGGGSQAAPSARASSSPSLALCQTDSPPLADSAHQHGTPAERVDKAPRYTSSHLPSRKGSKATGGRVLLRPQPGKSRRFRGLICHRRTQIKAEAIVCRYCGRDQTSVAASVRTQSGQIPTLSVKDTSRPTSDFSQESEPSRSVVSEPDIGKQQTNSTEPDSDRPGASSEQSASNFRWLWVVGAIAVGILVLTVQQKYKKEPIGVVERPDGLPEQAISQQADPRAMISSTNPTQPSVRHVQALLSELGFDPGPIDGVLGSRTRAAVRAFEIDFGVDPGPTGYWDLELDEYDLNQMVRFLIC